MRRIIEKLAHERKQKQDHLERELEELKKKSKEFLSYQDFGDIQHLLSLLEDHFISLLGLFELLASLTDAKDREWDALGSHHVGKIFKSMEWRVDKLAAEYGDVKILMKKFLLLREKLDQLLLTLEKKKMPSPAQVKELSEPLEDWRYAGFENRFRGYEQEIKKHQERYLAYFKNGRKVIDLGCGRGEFLELLEEKGIKTEGIDINAQMTEICQDKGLNCQKGDLLEKLALYENGTLGGIFCSQVIEHLPPAYLKRMVELSYFKLAPSSYLVFETVNPTSVFSLVQIYLLDLSHQQPVHPQALKFLMESSGFEEVAIKYSSSLDQEKLEEIPGKDERTLALNQNIDKLNKLLYAPANYAAIGLKP
ncbi:MAG: class I SAM-dependent methyltransferase [Candidatus Aminicenantes bacterium]